MNAVWVALFIVNAPLALVLLAIGNWPAFVASFAVELLLAFAVVRSS